MDGWPLFDWRRYLIWLFLFTNNFLAITSAFKQQLKFYIDVRRWPFQQGLKSSTVSILESFSKPNVSTILKNWYEIKLGEKTHLSSSVKVIIRLQNTPAMHDDWSSAFSEADSHHAPLSETHDMTRNTGSESSLQCHRQSRWHGCGFWHAYALQTTSLNILQKKKLDQLMQTMTKVKSYDYNLYTFWFDEGDTKLTHYFKCFTDWWDSHTSSITDRFTSKKTAPPWGVRFPLLLLTSTRRISKNRR